MDNSITARNQVVAAIISSAGMLELADMDFILAALIDSHRLSNWTHTDAGDALLGTLQDAHTDVKHFRAEEAETFTGWPQPERVDVLKDRELEAV
jgi:hypothetical protein